MTRLAPVMTELFPEVRSAMEHVYRRTTEKAEWTSTTEAALLSLVGLEIDERVRRVIVQGIITDYVFNELRDEKALYEWSRTGFTH